MDNMPENKMTDKCCAVFKKLCSMKIKDDLDFGMSVVSDDGSVCFEKRIKSTTEFDLMKTLAVLAAVIVVMSTACSIGCWLKKN